MSRQRFRIPAASSFRIPAASNSYKSYDSYDDYDIERSSGQHGAFSGGGGDCCPLVVDPKTFLVLLGFIGLAVYFLQIEITMSMLMMARKRKRRSFTHISPPLDIIHAGNEQN